MARDKKGHPPEPNVDEVLNELAAEDADSFVAGPTARNEAGDMKRAAAKATGEMGASKKLDPDLNVDPAGKRPKSGSRAGIHGFKEVNPSEGVAEAHRHLSNKEIARGSTHTARVAPAPRSSQVEDVPAGGAGGSAPHGGGTGRARVPAPGNAVNVPKGTLVRGHPTATQAGGRSQSSTGDEKPPKRSARAGTGQTKRPLAKGGTEER